MAEGSDDIKEPDGDTITVKKVRIADDGKPIDTSFGPIEEFEATEENIPLHPTIMACGKRRTGKTTSLDNLMEKTMRHIPFGIVMTSTKMNGFWQTRVPERFVFQGWREDILAAFTARQKKLVAKFGKKDPRTFAFIILDDVIADQKAIRYSKLINSFFVEGRHMNATILITTQYMKGVGPMVRGNVDIAILQPIYSIADREVIRDLYGGFMAKKDFMRLMDEVVGTEEAPDSTASAPKMKVRVMMVQDWRQTCNIQEKFKYWCPKHSDDVPPYKLCLPKYWKKDDSEGFGNNDASAAKPKKALADTLEEVSRLF